MHEFISLGIATELGGVNGLYYLVRQELKDEIYFEKLNTIIQKFDLLIDKLDRIGDELQRLNDKCNELISATYKQIDLAVANSKKNEELLKSIDSNTALAAYHQERISTEENFQSWLLASYVDYEVKN